VLTLKLLKIILLGFHNQYIQPLCLNIFQVKLSWQLLVRFKIEMFISRKHTYVFLFVERLYDSLGVVLFAIGIPKQRSFSRYTSYWHYDQNDEEEEDTKNYMVLI